MAQLMGTALFAAILPYLLLSFKERSEYKKTMMNEIITLLCCYTFVTFNIVSVEGNFQLGYFLIGFLSMYILITIIYVVVVVIKAACQNLRKYCLKRTYRKNRVKL